MSVFTVAEVIEAGVRFAVFCFNSAVPCVLWSVVNPVYVCIWISEVKLFCPVLSECVYYVVLGKIVQNMKIMGCVKTYALWITL